MEYNNVLDIELNNVQNIELSPNQVEEYINQNNLIPIKKKLTKKQILKYIILLIFFLILFSLSLTYIIMFTMDPYNKHYLFKNNYLLFGFSTLILTISAFTILFIWIFFALNDK
jgi:hypothetical protein